MTMRTPKSCLTRALGMHRLVMRAPANEPAAPATRSATARVGSKCAVAMWGMSAEKEGGVTASALIPAAFFALNHAIMRAGMSRKPGPTPRNPLRTEIGTASRRTSRKFSVQHGRSAIGRKSRQEM